MDEQLAALEKAIADLVDLGKRDEHIRSMCEQLEVQGVPKHTLKKVREYAATIYYCQCGHERSDHGNGIVDRRCFVMDCACTALRLID